MQGGETVTADRLAGTSAPSPAISAFASSTVAVSMMGTTDVAVNWGGAALGLTLLAWRWSALLLAHAAGVTPRRERLILTLALLSSWRWRSRWWARC